MKHLFTLLLCAVALNTYAQVTQNKDEKLIQDVQERYAVLADSPSVRHGLYQAIYKKKIAIASGRYNRGKRVGVWHFYSKKGILLQNYDYGKHAIMFSSPVDTMRAVRYVIDDEIKPTDTITAPIKPGSVYFGYMAYVKQIAVPPDLGVIDYSILTGVVELLVSPGGRLADFKIRVVSPSGFINKVADMPLDTLSEEDKVFLPASKNGNNVGMTVIITCRFDSRGRIYF
ncbi:hypothetical protein LJ707_14705 [Mucilaginibacter sp. UR6-1]|uniref:hypothetical protein n=1 Tax=Mucilaginibacter sp. UR6-1 TaxID=1435643 RepID=UPI001E53DE74|nr:hypothetical protein [Mucilaginibacter sp. UR6-1]MCC8410188.1 hypothetical protein [Mucilaginibacter sp. UR6-1]